MDDQPADRLLGVLDGEERRSAARLAELAPVADLAAALGVERRAIEDDLGGALAGQLVELHPVADDRHDRAGGGRRLVAEERRVAGAGLDRLVERGQLGVLRELGLLAGAAPLALLGEGGLEPRRSTPTPYSAASSTSGRSGSRTCRGAGTRGRPATSGASGGRSSGRRPITRSAPGRAAASAASSWPVPASRVRANWRLLALDRGEDRVSPLDEVRVGLAHDLDDDLGRLGHERLAPAEEPAVADGAADDPAQDVAAALVRRQDAVGDRGRRPPGRGRR